MKTNCEERQKNSLTLELSDAAYKLLANLAQQSSSDLEDVLCNAIGLYGIAEEARIRGQELCIARQGKMQKTIVYR